MKQRGFALAIVVLTMLLLSLLIPLLYYLTERESNWSVAQKQSTIASQLAAAGVERALWKLKETNDHWVDLLSGVTLTGYNNDVNYTDVNQENGIYRVLISSTPDRNKMLVICTAKDSKAGTYKAVRAYARRTQVCAALHGYQIVNSGSAAGMFTVHWGPIYATGNMYLNTLDINQLYPRKFAAGNIAVISSTGVYVTRDENPSSPNSDNLEYYAYANVSPIVTPDFDFYRASAAALGTYYSTATTFASLVTTPGKIYFFDGNVTLQGNNKFIQGIIIAMKKITLNGDNTAGQGNYSVTPTTGTQEYQRNCPIRKDATGASAFGDTVAQDEFPGDGGLATYKSFTFGTTSGGAGGKRVSVKGFIYVGTELAGGVTNTQVVHGAIALSKTASITSGKFEIFYDPNLEIRTLASEIYIDKWEEIMPTPF
ncbi:MAG: hypothetical protein LHV69_06735 [Elusimicrobia bacterium]|nr:hypothetical protein [Candidatus Obscuribacterium magneticum]